MSLILAAAGFILLSMFMRMFFRNILSIMIIIAVLYLIGIMSQAHSGGFPTLQDDLRQDRIERYYNPQCQIVIRDAIIQHKSSDQVATIARDCTGHQSNPFFEMCRKTPGCLEKMAQ
jgi:hypothetical protein